MLADPALMVIAIDTVRRRACGVCDAASCGSLGDGPGLLCGGGIHAAFVHERPARDCFCLGLASGSPDAARVRWLPASSVHVASAARSASCLASDRLGTAFRAGCTLSRVRVPARVPASTPQSETPHYFRAASLHLPTRILRGGMERQRLAALRSGWNQPGLASAPRILTPSARSRLS